MKRFGNSILLVLSACMLSACGSKLRVDAESVSVCFQVRSNSFTKAGVEAYERNIVRLDLFTFRKEDGMLDRHVAAVSGIDFQSSDPHVVAELLTDTEINWFVVSNAPVHGFDDVVNYMGFLSKVSKLEDCTFESLVMFANGSLVPDVDDTDPVYVNLRRYCSKVSIGNVSVTWADAVAAGNDSRITRIALVNVCGSVPYSAVPTYEGLWFNKMDIDENLSTFLKDMTVKDLSVQAGASPVAVDAAFYAMPNPVNNNVNSVNNPVWSPRNTRLSILLMVNGQPNWYPINIPAMGCNKHYRVDNLEIKGPGSLGPDMPVTRDEISFEIEVMPWADEPVEAHFVSQVTP